MEKLKNKFYNGPPGLRLNHLLGSENSINPINWFPGSRVYFVHRGRTAIGIACDLLDLRSDDEVLAPSYNCGAEIDPFIKHGAKVVLYRIDRSMQIDIEDLRCKITAKTRVIYITHYFGFPQAVSSIKHLCEEKGLFLIEDCALALFSCDRKMVLGSFGDVSVYSLPKTLPVPDGGVLSINNSVLANKTVELANSGIIKITDPMIQLQKAGLLRWLAEKPFLYELIWPLYKKLRGMKLILRTINSSREEHGSLPSMPTEYGFDDTMRNRKVSSMTMRILGKCEPDKIVEKRRNNFNQYLYNLSGNRDITPLFDNLPDGVCPLSFPVIVPHRARVWSSLRDQSIYAIKWWEGYHQDLPWNEYPDACYLKDRVLTLPLHEDLGEENVAFISNYLISLLKNMNSKQTAA